MPDTLVRTWGYDYLLYLTHNIPDIQWSTTCMAPEKGRPRLAPANWTDVQGGCPFIATSWRSFPGAMAMVCQDGWKDSDSVGFVHGTGILADLGVVSGGFPCHTWVWGIHSLLGGT